MLSEQPALPEHERMFYTPGLAGRVPGGAVQGRAEPGGGDAVRVVAEPLHGLRAPVHVLLRPGLRAASRPSVRLAVRDVDPGEVERRRGAAPRAGPAVVAWRGDRDRRCE